MAALLSAGGPPVLTRDWFHLLGFSTPHAMTKALRHDSRFVSHKSGVTKWELAQ